MNRTDMPGYEPISLGFMLKEEDTLEARYLDAFSKAMARTADYTVAQIEQAVGDIRTCAAAPQDKPDPLRWLIEIMLRHYPAPATHSAALEILKGQA